MTVFGIPATLTCVPLIDFKVPEKTDQHIALYAPLKKEFTISLSIVLNWNNSTNPR